MRFLRLDLSAFGPFTGQSLTFAEEPALEIIFGPNEAGKSSALRAIEGLLHGIPERTMDAHLHQMSTLRIGALVAGPAGEQMELIRRKGRKDTLRDGDDKPVDAAALEKMCGGITEALFETAFGIDQERLRRGAQQILAGGGDVGQSLFGAGLGAGVQDVLQSLAEEADQLYRPRASKPDLNAALRSFDEARKAIRRNTLRPDAWTDLDRQREDLEEQAGRIAQESRDLRQEQGDLERRRDLLPRFTELDALIGEQEELGGVAVLPPEAPERRRRAQENLADGGPRAARLEQKLQKMRDERANLIVPEDLLARADEIELIQNLLGAHEKAQKDRQRLEGELNGHRDAAGRALQRLGHDDRLEDATGVLLDALGEARVRKLAKRHTVLTERLAGHEDQLRAKRTKLERTRGRAKELPSDADGGELRTALKSALKGATLEERIATLLRDERRRARRVENQLAKLGLWSGPLTEVGRLELPTEETVEVHRQLEAKLVKAIERVDADLESNAKRQADCLRSIAEAEAGRELPSEEALRSTRGHRDDGWSLVRRAWLDEEDITAEAEAFDSHRELPEAYEQSVGSADSIADGLRAEAERVAQLTALFVERDHLGVERDRFQEQRRELEQRRASELVDWQAVWNPSEIEPLSPQEMTGWLVRHGRLVEEVEALETVRSEREDSEGRARLLAAGLASALGDTAQRSLDEWISIAESAEVDNRKQEGERRRLRKLQADLESEIEELERDLDGLRTELAEWRVSWGEAVGGLGLDEDSEPEEAEAVLKAMADLQGALEKVHDHEERIRGIDRDAETFTATVRSFLQACVPSILGLPVVDAARELRRRLDDGKVASKAHSDLGKQIQERENDLEEARAVVDDAKRALAELVRLAAVDGPDELSHVEDRCLKIRDLEDKTSGLRTRIREVSRCATVDEARVMIAEVDEAQLESRLAEITDRLSQIEPEQKSLYEAIGETRKQLEQMDGTSQAAEDAARAEEELAKIRRLTERYALVRLASHVLEREVEAYRREHQDPILKRASEIFVRVTLGSFSRLIADRDEQGSPLLICVRPDGAELGVAALSEGTRDQLYFALRLAAVEHHVSRNEPIPFIVDDVFVNFDDERARAGLELLGEIAGKTQVLFFTHHTRLRELALEALGGRCHVHELASPTAVA